MSLEASLNPAQISALREYEALLIKWQKSINLIAPSTIGEIWERHILDSVQVFQHFDRSNKRSLIDFGSGGGFPALVIAILDAYDESETKGNMSITCVESVQKKCAFLKDVTRRLKLNVKVENKRIEALSDLLYDESQIKQNSASRETYGLSSDLKFDYITARALATVDKLLHYSAPFFRKIGTHDAKELSTIYFLKGQDVDKELTEASKYWHIEYQMTESKTHEFGQILKITDFSAK